MSQSAKDILYLFGGVLFLAVLVGTIVSISVNWEEGRDFSRQIKCKEIGGTYVYENSNWICK